MASILVLKSSILGDHSSSSTLINELVDNLSNTASIIERDLATHPVPVLDSEIMMGLRGAENLSERQQRVLALSDQLITEIQVSDTLVIAAPMYNFSVPTQLKNWIDLIARADVTFTYTEQGPKGLLTDKKAIVVTTRGGIHKDSPNDHVVGYMKTVLGFIGISDIEFVYSEALAMGDEPAKTSMDSARRTLLSLF
ncbi:FMN-dependent NADH-azoreductase [Enterovibrio norvegicus]|uniref:FMN-dependent NADH-azoreductase n=1 Tax=Enterovibrio norvegicus TaxID=188144 RepID=UPI0002DE63BB|nr:FMN-dependent NADH-azoreductase [Enterovibrio norvegicus]OEE61638.1 FMN-dependent NADH-azoreductase [Enterovibrio norvegicus]